jgi:2-C-methyl-D-erythritol 2,4-cyclodiphosphate synthase
LRSVSGESVFPLPPALAAGDYLAALRVGIGHDTHRLEPGGPLKLGGVSIPHDRHLVGHSDADALLHAVTDALLGAAGLGDIGEQFPDTDPRYRGIDSAQLLTAAWKQVQQLGYQAVNLDCIVFAQKPKLSSYKDRIRQNLSRWLDLADDCIAVKAKTGEQVGCVGREEAIQAQCVVLLFRPPRSGP